MLDLTSSEARILDIVARHHRVPFRCVLMIAAAMGPSTWRNCVPVVTYVPKQAAPKAWWRRSDFDWGI